jgi:hypothetical protein
LKLRFFDSSKLNKTTDHQIDNEASEQFHGRRLDKILSEFSLCRQPVPKDGNCLFSSVSNQLIHASMEQVERDRCF